jgi:hypothetical protein
MKLISMICPGCGATVEVDEYSKSFYCKYCNVTTIIEKDSYNTNYNDESIQKAEMFISKHQNYKEAKSKYEYVNQVDPNDPRAVLGLLRCATRDLQEKLYVEVEGETPIWLPGMEERVKSIFSKYEQIEKKQEALRYARSVYEKYLEQNRQEYETLKEKYPEEKVEEYNNYDSTIKAENKIISSEDIKNIVDEMNSLIIKYNKIDEALKKKNEFFDYKEKENPFNDSKCKLSFHVNMHDNTESDIDNYDQFMEIYTNRLSEIKSIWIKFTFNYSVVYPGKEVQYIYQDIDLNVYEDRIKIETKINSTDHRLDYLYNMIRQMVLNAPERYDAIIKKRTFIMSKVGLAYGLIPSILLCLLSCASESIRLVYMTTYVLFPIATIMLGFAIGITVSFFIMGKLYATLIPEKKYAGYDKKYGSVYTDNVEDYINTSEVLIGKNINNKNKRDKIKSMYEQSSKLILIELAIVAIISIVLIGLGYSL